ncbi:MAG: hypothetical protein GY700_07245, partial [Propionibacteriaceae bacterium]|nr:hypothetical protein [Propionibacteriaceae bacterium]
MAKITGEPEREVYFYLPTNNIPLLRKIPGFEDFNAQLEVLHCESAATGTVDAPRAFSLKLGQITSEQCNMKPSHIDRELCIRREGDHVTALMTKHVDDLKITGTPERVKAILTAISAVFGELKIEWHAFTNCGVRHIQCSNTMQITLDQTEYTANLRIIVHAELRGAKPEDLCGDELHQLYQSLLGAVAYLTHTRVDIMVFIVALQRVAAKPCIMHVKRLNKLLTWTQRNPKKLVYRNFGGGRQLSEATKGTHLRAVADASYKKEAEDGYGMRGAIYG